MSELIKPWNDGGNLSVSYNGDGDGSAIFSSDSYEGIDREIPVRFVGGDVIVERTVRQEGIRQPIGLNGGGIFRVLGGGRFGVLKSNNEPIETYTRLTYIECTGEQYIDLGYVVQEDDVIEMDYLSTSTTSTDKMLFGSYDGNDGYIWFSLYSNTAYVRFGDTSSKSVTNARMHYKFVMEKGSCSVDGTNTVTLEFSKLSEKPIYLFARCGSNLTASLYAYCKCFGFKVTKTDGTLVMNLKPCKRDSDGAIGMLDIVSGQFFTNQGTGEDFIAGNEIKIPQGYELIDYVTFSKNKLYDLGIISSTDKIEVMFARNETTSTNYMYGVVTSPHTASVTAYLSSGGAWRFGSSYKGITMTDKSIHRVEIYNGNIVYDFTTGTFTKSTFTTPNTAVLGGYRTASDSLSKTYQGKIYYFRIYNNNELRLDWFPCKRLSDGVEGFWDCVTQSFVEPIS